MNKNVIDFTQMLKIELKKRQNPTDLKAIHIGKIVNLNPVTVSIQEGKILLKEYEELFISEWFRFRCNIDKTTALSSEVPEDLNNAIAVTEIHSFTGSACNMPSAVSYLADAITKVNTELLALKCDLQIGDFVSIGSLEQLDRYILLDKVLEE